MVVTYIRVPINYGCMEGTASLRGGFRQQPFIMVLFTGCWSDLDLLGVYRQAAHCARRPSEASILYPLFVCCMYSSSS